MEATIEIHREGAWHPAAEVQAFGDDRCRLEYLPQYVFGDNPVPVALELPVGFEPPQVLPDGTPDHRVPAFLYDLVPQGRGRQFLLGLLGLPDHDAMVMPLLLQGAFNPIGCLRISTAVDFYREQARLNPDPVTQRGFALRDIQTRSAEFLEHMALHAMLAAGTTGVQGVAPKYLLTQDREGRWFADMALDDARAGSHWLVKLPRGRSSEDLVVHRNEAAYLRVARACGLRVHGDARLEGVMLFLPRFDRAVVGAGVQRLHQESLASLADLCGFGVATTQNALLAALRRHATNPLAETVEFLRRDVLNLALRNTDNHARNTAVQRLADGTVQLTPLFDFAPMFMDPELVPRSVHWRNAAGVRLDRWHDILDELNLPAPERDEVVRQLKVFGAVVETLPQIARECGVDDGVLQQCLATIEQQARQLSDLQTSPARPGRPPAVKRSRRPRHG